MPAPASVPPSPAPRRAAPAGRLEELRGQMQALEKELARESQQQQAKLCYRVQARKVRFTDDAAARHRLLRLSVPAYVLHSRFLVLLTAPMIWLCALPILLTDLIGTLYQTICFPIYGIPQVRRRDYVAFDRHHLSYLNFVEKLNCEYCAYVNGILAYFTEIAARTEQHWCPIKHAGCEKCAHSRYGHFLEFGDAEQYRRRVEEVRRDYRDLKPR